MSTKEKIMEAWEEYRKTGICPGCGFNNNGIMRVHNVDGECWLLENTKIKPLLNQLKKG